MSEGEECEWRVKMENVSEGEECEWGVRILHDRERTQY